MRYQWNGETMTTDVVSALTSALTGYVTTTMALKGNARCATLINGALGVGGIVLKNYTGSPIAHEMLEAVGYSGFGALGAWAAAAMGNNASVPVWLPKKATASVIASVPRYFPPPAPAAAVAARPSGGWETEY